MIERYNVLELIGTGNNKYHSCIITCYSFDFMFFEQRVLPKLRQAGIINVNIFVDAKIFQQQINKLEGSYYTKKSYSITPIKLQGAFHPKIILGLGKNNGFLAIGSGNLTNSGFSSNDEVWGAFHTFKTESEATPLFKTVYQYLKPLEEYCHGINKTKWNWILNSSSWLKDLLENDALKSIIDTAEEKTQLLHSLANDSIYKQLINSLPKEKLKSLVIISPYHNKSGQIIDNFLEDLKPEKVQVVLDSRFGTVPFKFNKRKQVQFYDWQNLESIKNHQSPRLHAKIMQFNYKTKTCLLIGSANASLEGLGTETRNTKNAEMCVFISSQENKNWVEEMNIILKDKGDFDIESYTPITIDNDLSLNESFEIKINHAELDFNKLNVHGNNFDKLTKNHDLVLVKKDDSFNKVPLKISTKDDFLSLLLTEEEIEDTFKIFIVDKDDKKESNTAFLHFSHAIVKTNPDEKSLRFLELINSDTLPDNQLIELLEYARFDKEKPVYSASKNSPTTLKEAKEDIEKEYNVLEEDEFNKNEAVIDSGYRNNSRHLTLLEEFLDHMTFGLTKAEDFSDSDERTLEEARDTGLDDTSLNTIPIERLSYAEGKKIKNKLHNTLEDINDAIYDSHEYLLDQLLENEPFNNSHILDDLKSVLIGLHLIFMKINHTFIEEKVQFRILFKNPDDLILFEKEKGFNISRAKSQAGIEVNEIIYNADVNLLPNAEELISKHKTLKLSYIDETPSITITHNYFKFNPVHKYSILNYVTVKGFLINTVSPFLLLLLNKKAQLNTEENTKFNIYKKRLFYRVAIIFNTVAWSIKEQNNCQLFLLNLFEASLPNNCNLLQVQEQLESINDKLIEHIDVNTKTKLFFDSELEFYLNWKKKFNHDKSILIKVLERRDVQKIIYKSKFGFCRIITIYNNELNVETPLGIFNSENDCYEIKGVKGGTKGIIYKNYA